MSDNEFFPAEEKVCPADEGDDPFFDGQANVDLPETPEDEQQENNNANEQPDKNPETEQRGVKEPEKEGPNAEGGTEALSVEDDEKVVKLRALDSGRDTEDIETDKEKDESMGDSESVEEAVKAKKQPKKEVHPDFVYTMESFVSKPFVEPGSGIPQDLVSLVHSFGFDALRRNNLQLLENNIICYIVGNYVEIMNLLTLEKRFIRSLSGIGIGAFSVHPERNVIALAEKGDRPMVCIYRYPQLDLYRLLPEGTQKEYSSCEFSTDGEMLAVVGSDPDYMLTLWEWRNEQIVLRAKAFSQDIYRVAWSTDLAGVLTTGGVGHIRFWKMADTFTGLKLQGKLGKFGKTELSDIEGFVTLPDGKVLTGSSWGNLLVWEGDLIKVQISRKNKRPCHTGLIMQIVMDEGELMTVGQDGWIRTWDFETVDTAECLEEGGVYELEPMNELQVSPSAKLMYMVKVQEADCTVWYAQDGDGAIWKLDLSFSHTSLAPESLVRFHSGAITDCVTSPYTHTAATIGRDGRIFIYDMIDKKQIVRRRFPSGGSKLIWCPPQVDPKGKLLVAGFDDGVVRVLQFGENPEPDPTRKAKHFALLDLGQALKPHVKSVTTMAYNGTGTFFVTGVSCPSPDDVDHSKTFTLPDTAPIAGFNMLSVKSRLLHDEDSAEKLRRYEIEKKARNDLRKARAEREPETEEDAQRLDDEEELIRQGLMAEIADWAPTYPSERSPLVYAALDPSDPNYFWTSFDKFDCGYIYKCRLGDPPISAQESLELARAKATVQSEVLSASSEPPVELPSLEEMSALDKRLTPTEPTDATRVDRQKTITCWTFSKSGNRLLFGMKDGTVRVQLLERPFDMTSFKGYWSFRMHDENRGGVNCIALSYDEKFLMSVGDDGTFFLCELMSEELQNKEITEFRARIPSAYEAHQTADDISDPKAQSIEQAKQKAEFDRLVSLAEQKKADTRKKVTELRLRFRRLKEQNERLPERIRLRKEAFTLRHEFNLSILALRDKKKGIIDELIKLDAQLLQLQDVLPPKEPIIRLHVPTLLPEECPEKQFAYNRDILQNFKQEMLDGTSGATDSKVTAPSSRPDINANNLTFSESLFPSMRNEPDTSVVTESTSEGETRAVIWLPVHCLAYDDYTVSLKRNYGRCSLPRPPPTSLIGVDLTTTASTSVSGLDTSKKSASDEKEGLRSCRPLPFITDLIYFVPFSNSTTYTSDKKNYTLVPIVDGKTEVCVSELEERMQRQIYALYQRDELVAKAGRLVRCFDAQIRLARHSRFKLDMLLKRAELHQLTLFTEFRLLKDFEKSELVLSEKKQVKDEERQELYSKLLELNTKIEARKKELERLSQKEHQLHEEFKATLGEGHKFTDFLTKVFKKRIKRKKQEAANAGELHSTLKKIDPWFRESEGSSSSDDSSFDESEDESEEEENILDLDSCPVGCPLEDFENTCAIRERRLDVEDEMLEEKKQLELLRKDLEAYSKKQRVVDAGLKQAQSELEAFQKELEKLSAICDREMIEKFGKVDDIERMEGVVVNPKVEELTTKMLILQEQFAKEEADMEERIRASRDACINKLRENTAYLTKTLMLFNEKEALQNDLNKKRLTKMGLSDESDISREINEVRRLMHVVQIQEAEIDQLSRELGLGSIAGQSSGLKESLQSSKRP
ncbi:WD repeat-containing protein 52 [Fasciola gigantica]|uniref:Cilia- and flagella-associated protein 44 n=1 Tax=Fasciola gigantica TaxID=46835 RepID=A0A504YX14_FASGI|nr:WD repeat-containing protein 52 [Fasciola gigantica]